MNNVERILHESKSFETFARGYFTYLSRLLSEVDIGQLAELLAELEDAKANGNTVFIAGNGGSAATASHMANDLGFGARRHVEPVLKAMSLTDNVSLLSALSNDVGYEQIFVRQLQVYFRPGDKLIVISASGNSSNLIAAAGWVRDNGGRVLGLLGFDGGKLKALCDVAVIVSTPPGEYGPVEDIHMILDHLLYSWLWSKIRHGTGKQAARR